MSKHHRKRTREDILAKRREDDERRAAAKPAKAVTPPYNPGTPLLYNPFRPLPRTPGGIIVVRRQS